MHHRFYGGGYQYGVGNPASDFPIMAQQNGAKLIILNREPTPLDS